MKSRKWLGVILVILEAAAGFLPQTLGGGGDLRMLQCWGHTNATL